MQSASSRCPSLRPTRIVTTQSAPSILGSHSPKTSKRSAFCAQWTIATSTFWGMQQVGLLLKRPGYELDMERVIAHAKQNGCFFEINSSPDRLDLSAENSRLASAAGVPIAISTYAHSVSEFGSLLPLAARPRPTIGNRRCESQLIEIFG
jgi:hypothetical protein